MNLGQVHSPLYEYKPVAMARFATEKRSYTCRRDLLGTYDQRRPVIRVPLQRVLWETLEAATLPLTMAQIYTASGYAWTDKARNEARVFMARWRKNGWLAHSGPVTGFAYSIRGRA